MVYKLVGCYSKGLSDWFRCSRYSKQAKKFIDHTGTVYLLSKCTKTKIARFWCSKSLRRLSKDTGISYWTYQRATKRAKLRAYLFTPCNKNRKGATKTKKEPGTANGLRLFKVEVRHSSHYVVYRWRVILLVWLCEFVKLKILGGRKWKCCKDTFWIPTRLLSGVHYLSGGLLGDFLLRIYQ